MVCKIPLPTRILRSDRPTIAGLVFDTPRRFTHHGAFNNPNDTSPWESLNFDLGNIALGDDYADSKGLPRAERFAWDGDKGLYFLNAFHSIHCLVRSILSSLSSPLITPENPTHGPLRARSPRPDPPG